MTQTMKEKVLTWIGFLILALGLFLLMTQGACAEPVADGGEFASLYTLLKSWCHGGLGKSIAIAFLLTGLGIGVVRGSVIASVSCLAAAVCLIVGPNIIDALFASPTA